MQLLVIKNGILENVTITEEVEKELKKDNWHYRLVTACKNYVLIDYDKDLARPYVKALLAKVNKLREVKMLVWVLFILVFTYITFLILFFLSFFKILDIEKSIVKIQEVEKTNKKTEQTILDINTNKAFNRVETTEEKQELDNSWHLLD